jgi:NitT/TauT family transport system substrate-binding protein
MEEMMANFAGKEGISRRVILRGSALTAAGIGFNGFRRAARADDSSLRVVVATAPPDPAIHFFYYALENGFFKDQGVDVTASTISSEATTVRALLAGEGDVALFVGGLSALQAWSHGAKVRCVSSFAPKLDYQIIAQQDVADIKQLSGKSFGISQAGTVSQMVAKLAIEKGSGDQESVKWVSLGNSSGRVQALISKTVQAGLVNSAFLPRISKYNYLHVIGDTGVMLPNFLYCWDIAMVDTVAKKRSQIQALIIGNARAVRWAYANPDAAVAISQKVLPDADKDELDVAIRAYIKRRYWNVDGIVPPATFEFTGAELLKRGELDKLPSYGDFVVANFGETAKSQLPAL